jgi:glycosyltransferase involved in cell wall biosynthesis
MDASGSKPHLSIEFEGAVLSPAPAPPSATGRTFSLGWFVQSTDVDSASVRYRCFHFARVLAPAFQSSYFTSASEIQDAIPKLDAIVIVKRLDRAVLEVVAAAKLAGVPTFLDLCDDLIAPGYSKNDQGVNLLHLLGVAPLLAGVTVPSAEMADRIEAYVADHRISGVPVHVIPDIAETWKIYCATAKTITGKEVLADLGNAAEAGGAGSRRILWFGNYGASHSNFGIFSLKPYLKALRAAHKDFPLELVIVSNSEAVYRALVHDCGFPTRYAPWSPTAVYSELAMADAALLTTGDDEFCNIKSSNRVLQALAAGVPVISQKNPSLTEFEDVIFSGRIEESLRHVLGPARERTVAPRMQAARRALERYAPQRLGKIWASLLKNAIRIREPKLALANRPKLLLVVEPGDSPTVTKRLFAAARGHPELDCEVLVSADALEQQPEFNSVIVKSPSIPRFFSGKLKGPQSLLLGRTGLVLQRPAAPIAKQLAGPAAKLGLAVVTSEAAINGELAKFARRRDNAPAPPSSIRAGPYPERLNPDGSVDWTFIVHQNARGWILDAICREIGSRQPDTWKVVYHPEQAPEATNYFFSHYLLLENYLERQPERLKNAKVFVWYTHPREENPVAVAKRLLAFDHVTKVIFACESDHQVWLDRGLPEEKAAVVIGAADPKLFRFHERGNGVVGLSSSFYERKNPDCLLEVIKLLPHRNFVLLGRKWNRYALFEEMRGLPNFTYKSAPYGEYPSIYASFDVFLSMSTLEGGPIPLVEAMMSNAVPVASRTGFAPDLIREGENGFIFEVDDPAQKIARKIEAAFALRGNVRATVKRYDWDNFSSEIVKLAQ